MEKVKKTTDTTLNKVEKKVNSLKNAFGKAARVVATALSAAAIASFAKSCIELGSDLAEVQNVVDVTFGEANKRIEEFAQNAAEQFGLSELSAKQYSSTMGAMLKSMGITGTQLEDMSIKMTELAGDMASFYNLDTDEAFSKIRSGISGETEPLKQLGINLSVANLEQYALTQGIKKSYSAMTQQEQALLRYNYLLDVTSDAQGDFARTSDSWANQVRILQLRFESLKSTLGQAFISALTPVLRMLNTLIAKLQQAALAFNSLIQKITGNSSSTSQAVSTVASSIGTATDNTEDLTASTEAAGTAAKEAYSGLAAFDEINSLTKNDSSGSDSGTDSALDDLDTVSTEMDEAADDVDSELNPALQRVLDAASKALQAIKDLIKSIGETWKAVWESDISTAYLESVADLLVAILDVITAIATSFKTAWDSGAGYELVAAFLTMLTNINEMIAAIAESFAGAFDSPTGVSICENILGILTGIFNIIGNIAERFTEAWTTAGIGDAIMSNILTIVDTILETIHSIVDATADWAKELDFTPLLESINGLLEAIQPLSENIGRGLEWFYENVLLPLASWTIEDAIPTFLDLLSAALDVLDEVIEALKPFAEWLWEDFLQPFGKWAGDKVIKAIQTVTDKLKDFSTWIQENQTAIEIIAAIIGDFATAWGIVSAALAIWNGVAEIATGVITVLGAAVGFITSPIGIAIATIAALIAIGVALYENWDTLSQYASQIWGTIKTAISAPITAIQTKISNTMTAIKTTWTTIWTAIKTTVTDILTNIHAFITTIMTAIQNFISPVLTAIQNVWTTIWTAIKTAVTDILTNIYTFITDIMTTIHDGINTALTAIHTIWTNTWTSVKTTVVQIFDDMWTAMKGVINSIIGGVESMANSVVNAINTVINALNGLHFDIPDWIPGLGGSSFGFNIPTLPGVSLPRLATGGIVDGATPLIAGEAGREAILPLESNTGWMDDLAAKIGEILSINIMGVIEESKGSGSDFTVTTVVNMDSKTIVEQTDRYRKRQGYRIKAQTT
jgi:phage-related protein